MDSSAVDRDVIECDEWQSLFVADKDSTDSRPEPARLELPELVVEEAVRKVQIELGRAPLGRNELQPQQVIPLDRGVQDPLDLRCEGRLIARGEVVVVRGKLCVRIVETFPN